MIRRIGLIGTVPDSARGSVAPELEPLLNTGGELVAFPSRVSAFPSTALEQSFQDIGHAEAGLTAVESGCDAIVIDSVGDYGLGAMRALLPVPAFGAGEAGMAEASVAGRFFAIVTVWPATMNFIPEGRLRAYGRDEYCRRIYNVGAQNDLKGLGGPAAYLSQVRRGNRTIIAALAQAMAAAASDGAEAILLGCTCMSPMAAELAALSPLPVINPLAAAVVAAAKSGPISPPEVGGGRREILRKMVEAVAGQPTEACPVCIAVADA